MNNGYVYLIEDNNNQTYKIGVTKNLVYNRLKKLQTGNSNKLNIISYFYSEYPFRLEKMLHNYFKEKRTNGEWFNLNNVDIICFSDLCNKYTNYINCLLENPFFNKNIR